MKTKKRLWILIPGLIILVLVAYFLFDRYAATINRSTALLSFLRNPKSNSDSVVVSGLRCGDSVFELPSSGMIGYLWDDSIRLGHRHQGIDIFAGTKAGETPVYAAYDGYLTRLPAWKSSLIIRIPKDPLDPSRQIWIYYTHMADADGNSFILDQFPPGSQELPVSIGTLLGYQGNYSGTKGNPVGVHLHFSIVKDNGSGTFLNELEINNTLDPSPYFNMALNAKINNQTIPVCNFP